MQYAVPVALPFLFHGYLPIREYLSEDLLARNMGGTRQHHNLETTGPLFSIVLKLWKVLQLMARQLSAKWSSPGRWWMWNHSEGCHVSLLQLIYLFYLHQKRCMAESWLWFLKGPHHPEVQYLHPCSAEMEGRTVVSLCKYFQFDGVFLS